MATADPAPYAWCCLSKSFGPIRPSDKYYAWTQYETPSACFKCLGCRFNSLSIAYNNINLIAGEFAQHGEIISDAFE